MSHPPRKRFSATPPRILSIAGSDPSGGAGVQADLKTFSALGCYGLSVITALTAQNTTGVQAIHIPPGDFCKAQLQALWDDIEIDAIKIGMLGNEEVVKAVAGELQSRRGKQALAPVVLDPVMVSTSGSLLLAESSIRHLIESLLPLCAVLTPNLPETEQILRHANRHRDISLKNVGELLEAAKALGTLGPQAVLIKGGHQIMSREALLEELSALESAPPSQVTSHGAFPGNQLHALRWQQESVSIVRSDMEPYSDVIEQLGGDFGQSKGLSDDVVVDVLYERELLAFTIFIKRHAKSKSTHGTGCTLSSAIASYLGSERRDTARQDPPSQAQCVHDGIVYVQRAISRGLDDLGQGAGPLNHLTSVTPRIVPAPASSSSNGAERAPFCARLIANSLPMWQEFTRHDFLKGLADASLSRDAFVYFLRQDYHFLKHYARVWASGAASFAAGSTFERIGFFATIAKEMINEAENHVNICETVWQIPRQELEQGTEESAATLAYTRFVLDVSRSGDALDLLVATGPCLLGYGEGANWVERTRNDSERGADIETQETSAIKEGFRRWIEYYVGCKFRDVVAKGIASLEEFAANDPPSEARMASLQRIWVAAIRLEIGMWDEAIHPHLRRAILAN